MMEKVTESLERYMDLLSTRQKLAATNIANADTPGYKAQDIDFQFEFTTLTRGEQPQISPTQGLVTRSDGNNVDVDREARMLAENAMRFNVASTLVQSQLKTILAAITGSAS